MEKKATLSLAELEAEAEEDDDFVEEEEEEEEEVNVLNDTYSPQPYTLKPNLFDPSP